MKIAYGLIVGIPVLPDWRDDLKKATIAQVTNMALDR